MSSPDSDADERRDAVLRRMLATPKPNKGGKERGGPEPAAQKSSGYAVGAGDLSEQVPEPLRIVMDENSKALAFLPR